MLKTFHPQTDRLQPLPTPPASQCPVFTGGRSLFDQFIEYHYSVHIIIIILLLSLFVFRTPYSVPVCAHRIYSVFLYTE